jgi:hypothetical protein
MQQKNTENAKDAPEFIPGVEWLGLSAGLGLRKM